MCDRESFAKIRDAIADLQKADAVQSEQIKTLFRATERQSETQKALVNRMLMLVGLVLILAVLALIWGGLGERGFNAVTNAAPTAVAR
jgi:hypothetical protein